MRMQLSFSLGKYNRVFQADVYDTKRILTAVIRAARSTYVLSQSSTNFQNI
jgi:hypothetical protein